MEFVIFTGLLPVRICIAVFAAVKAGVIRSYVPALNAMAALPHSLMFQVAELNAVGLPQNVQGHAAGKEYVERIIPPAAQAENDAMAELSGEQQAELVRLTDLFSEQMHLKFQSINKNTL